VKTSQRRDWIRLTAPLTAFGLTTMTMGMIASRHTGGYPAPPFIRLFFSDTIHLKGWLTTGAGVLALFQIVSAARVFALSLWAFLEKSASHLWISRGAAHIARCLSLYLSLGIFDREHAGRDPFALRIGTLRRIRRQNDRRAVKTISRVGVARGRSPSVCVSDRTLVDFGILFV